MEFNGLWHIYCNNYQVSSESRSDLKTPYEERYPGKLPCELEYIIVNKLNKSEAF